MRSTRVLAFAVLASLVACDASDSPPDPGPAPQPSHFDPPPTPPADDGNAKLASYGLSVDDAYGPATATLPEGAKLVDLATFQQTLASKPKLASAARAAKATADEAQQEKDDDTAIAMYLAAHPDPELAARFDATPTLGPTVHLRADRDLDVDLSGQQRVVTIGRAGRRHIIADTIRTASLRSNRENLYTYFRSLVSAAEAPAYPAISAATSDADLEMLISRLARRAYDANKQAFYDRLTGFVVESTCSDEATGGAPIVYDPPPPYRHADGSVWANASWPNKAKTTCVKDQGKRSSCSAFALTSALERRELLTTGRKVDLSEQHLYATYKSKDDNWRDGASMQTLTNVLGLQSYEVPLEQSWVYNTSMNLSATPAEPFHGACLDYSGVCTATSHQSPLVCTQLQDFLFCAWTPPPAPFPSGVHAVMQSPIQVLEFSLLEDSVPLILNALRFGDRQVLVSVKVDGAFVFGNDDPNGIISNGPAADEGAHAVHAVAYVANETLPTTFPQGAGGGYVVIKNSWGRRKGDQGYVYMPVDQLRATLYSAVIL